MNQTASPLKIVIAVHHFPPTFKGGAEWRAHRTATWLQNQGHRVKIICVDAIDDSQTADLRWVDDTFDSLQVRRLFLNLSNAPDRDRWEYDNPWIEDHLTRYLAEEKPDIFHLISGYLMTAGAIRAAKKQHIPVVLTLTDFWFLCREITLYRTSGQVCAENTAFDCVRCGLEKQRRFRLPAQKLPAVTKLLWHAAQPLPVMAAQIAAVEDRMATLRSALNEVEIAICPSRFLLETYVKRGFEARQMEFLRQGLGHMPPQPPHKKPSKQLRIGYIGQIAAHKGVHILVDAFLRSGCAPAQAQLKLYGNAQQFPDFYQELQRKIAANRQAEAQIRFMGTFNNHEVSQIYEEIDVLVVPSIWYENSPNVILEAFAHRTPVIASDLGGMAELVGHQETGLLFRPNDAADLAQKLKLMVDNRTVLDKLNQNITSPTTLDAEMARLLEIYKTVLLKTAEQRSFSLSG